MRRNPWRLDLALFAIVAGYFLAAIASSVGVLSETPWLLHLGTKAFVVLPILAAVWVAPGVVWDVRNRKRSE